MRTTILLLGAILYVGRVGGKSAQCMEATKAAINYRDFVLGTVLSEKRANRFLKIGIQQFGINIHSDKEIEELICSVVDADEKTIAYIARHNPVVTDERQLALAYSTMQQRLQEYSDPSEIERLAKQMEFYDTTGYPDFPLKISGAQLSNVISEEDFDSILRLSRFLLFDAIDREDVFDVLNTSTSLEEFVRATLRLRNFSLESEEAFEEYVLAIIQAVRGEVPSVAARYHHRILTQKFLDVLEKTGFMGVTRGGPELYSCDFIADTAVEALGYVVDIVGSPTVQSFMTEALGLNFMVDDKCAVRAWVCALLTSKTQTEFILSISETARGQNIRAIYGDLTGEVGYVLSPAVGSIVDDGMTSLRLIKIVESLNIPLTKNHAKQFAALLKAWSHGSRGTSCDEDELAQVLQDADSLEDANDAVSSCDGIRIPPVMMEHLRGKTDSVVLLVSSLYQLAMSAEELGLLMLPLE